MIRFACFALIKCVKVPHKCRDYEDYTSVLKRTLFAQVIFISRAMLIATHDFDCILDARFINTKASHCSRSFKFLFRSIKLTTISLNAS